MTIEAAYGRVPATDFPDLKFERSPHEPPETPVDPPSRTAFDVVDESGLLRLRRYRPDNHPGNGPAVLLVYSFFKRPSLVDFLPHRTTTRPLLCQSRTVC